MEVNLTKAQDVVASRRADMIALLESRKAERGAAKEARKTAMETARTETGGQNVARSSEEFWALFNAAVKALREVIDTASQKGTVTEEDGKALWQSWMESCADMQSQLNDCTLFLAAFDVRKAQTMIDSLLETADDTKARIMPRRKFAFSKRPTGTMANMVAASAPPLNAPPQAAASATAASKDKDRLLEDELTVENLSGQVVYIARGHYTAQARTDLATLEKEIAAATADGSPVPAHLAPSRRRLAAQAAGRDLRLLSLTDCTVLLLDPLRAVRIDGLTRCTVITGTVAGSVLLHNCEDCSFHIAARQLRLHTSTRCDFYLHCLSRPIIEHCTAFRFSPYGIKVQGLEEDMVSAGLDKPARPDLWRSVDDFGWHRVQASPNWSVLESGGRMGEAQGQALPQAAADKGIRLEYPKESGEAADAAALGSAAPAAAPVVAAGAAGPAAPKAATAAAPATKPAPVEADDEL